MANPCGCSVSFGFGAVVPAQEDGSKASGEVWPRWARIQSVYTRLRSGPRASPASPSSSLPYALVCGCGFISVRPESKRRT
jgi:hypothetical protein